MQARADPSVAKAIAIFDNPRSDVPNRKTATKRKAGRKPNNFKFKFDEDIVAARIKYPSVFKWWIMWQSYVESHPTGMEPTESAISDYMQHARGTKDAASAARRERAAAKRAAAAAERAPTKRVRRS